MAEYNNYNSYQAPPSGATYYPEAQAPQHSYPYQQPYGGPEYQQPHPNNQYAPQHSSYNLAPEQYHPSAQDGNYTAVGQPNYQAPVAAGAPPVHGENAEY